jgi:hypothetical protein
MIDGKLEFIEIENMHTQTIDQDDIDDKVIERIKEDLENKEYYRY